MAAVNPQCSTTLRPAVAYLAQQSKEKGEKEGLDVREGGKGERLSGGISSVFR